LGLQKKADSLIEEDGGYKNISDKNNVPESTLETILKKNPSDPELAIIRTYKHDVAQAIQDKNASLVSIAMAEKRRQEQEEQLHPHHSFPIEKIAIGLISILLIAGGATVIGLFFYNNAQQPTPITVNILKKIIIFDNETELDLTKTTRENFPDKLELIKTTLTNSNSMTSINLMLNTATDKKKATASEFFNILKTKAESALLRSFDKDYALGLYKNSDQIEPFLIIKTSLFDNAFAGMLVWEKTMVEDLSPIFVAKKPVLEIEQSENISSTTPEIIATSTKEKNEETFLASLPEKIIWSDEIVLNRDIRVAKNTKSNIVFMYSFLDNETLVICRNEEVFKQVLNKFIAAKLIK
jgi:hypothetical protein